VFGGDLYGFVRQYIGGMMCIGNVFGEYRKYANVAYRDYFLWWTNSGDYVNSYTQW